MQVFKSIYSRTLAVFILLSLLGGAIVAVDTFNHIETQKHIVLRLAGAESNVLSQRLNAAISSVYTLETVLRENQFKIQPERFKIFANQIINYQLAVSSLQYAPDGIVTYVVPFDGNEAIIGHNLFGDQKRNKEAFDAVEKHLLTVAGPFELIQGGVGLVARLPIFQAENQSEKFWGFATVLIRISELIESSGIYKLSSRGYDWTLWRDHPDTGLPHIFSGTTDTLIEDSVQLAIAVPNATWFLSIKPREGWLYGHSLRMTLGIGIFLIIAGIGAGFAFLLQRQPLLLQQQVDLQTKELQAANLKLLDSEYRYRSLVENTDDLITRVDREDRLLYVNTSSLKYWGLPPEECLGQSAFDFIDPEDCERTINLFQNWLKSESNYTTFENRQLHSSGKLTDMQWMIASLRDSSGEIVEFSSIARDVSKHKKLMEEYKRTAQLAALGTVAAGVAHEINNPLQGIVNYAALIGKAPEKTERVMDLSQRIIKEGDRVARITKDMLYFSKDNRREFITTDIRELISGAIALMRTNIRHKKIQIEVNLPEQPVAMRVHPQGVQQIVMNLLDNSCDAVLVKEATSEEMVIQVSGQVEDSNGRPQFILVVEDNGEGIPTHIIQKVKEAFFTTKLAMKGTGLGLSIVNDIVRNHDGTLSIESVEGQFTKMLVSLPIRSDET